MHSIKKLASQTVIYGLSSIIGRVANYLLVPFYTSIFLPEEYGVVTEFYAYAAFFSILYTYGMETAYFRFAAQGQELQSFNIATSAILFTSLIISVLLALFATSLINWIGYPGCERYIYYLIAILAIDAMLVIPFAQLRLRKQPIFFASAKLLQIGLNILLNLLLLYGLAKIYIGQALPLLQPFVVRFYTPDRRVAYVFIANLMANVALLPLLSKSFIQLRFQLPWQQLKSMLAYAFPLLLMGLAGTVNEMLSRALLRHLLPPGFYSGKSNEAILGIFGACYKLSVFMSLGIQAFRYAAEPFFFVHAQDKHAPTLFSQAMHGFILIACFILFAISANLDLLSYLFLRNPEYRTGTEIVPYLLLAYLWLGVYYNLSVWFKLADKTYYGTLITGMGAIVTIVLNILLVPRMGYWGSVWAAVASYAIMSGLCYFEGQKHYPIPYQVGHGLAYIVGTISLVPLVRSIAYTNWASAMASNLGLTLLFGLLLYGLGRRDWRL